jgi:hypothetical protein
MPLISYPYKNSTTIEKFTEYKTKKQTEEQVDEQPEEQVEEQVEEQIGEESEEPEEQPEEQPEEETEEQPEEEKEVVLEDFRSMRNPLRRRSMLEVAQAAANRPGGGGFAQREQAAQVSRGSIANVIANMFKVKSPGFRNGFGRRRFFN